MNCPITPGLIIHVIFWNILKNEFIIIESFLKIQTEIVKYDLHLQNKIDERAIKACNQEVM